MKNRKNIEFCRSLRGLSRQEVAERMGIGVQTFSLYENGQRIGATVMPRIAKALDVSEAYLRGIPNRLSVRNFMMGEDVFLPIVAETEIEGYGAFYLLEHSPTPGGALAVILHGGKQFTPAVWGGKQPLTVEEIPAWRWVNIHGLEAEIMDGLPE